tara:strand:+ start:3999 stop:4538 length:540 start_codon:yes stop_codon:yes gene_type:complete
MELEETSIQGAYLIKHQSFSDDRGLFYEMVAQDVLNGVDSPELNKINISESNYGVLRGLHYQIKEPQIKFVSCLKGKVIDFAVDIRKHSSSFGEVIQYELTEEEPETLYLPLGVAHGFISLSERSLLLYLVSGIYNNKLERGINYKSIDLNLPIEPILINKRDANWPNFDEAEYYENKI